MRLRGLITGGAALLGAGAVLARLRDNPALPPALVGEQHTYRWRGVDVAYSEAGDPTDPDLVLIHGIHAAGTNQEFDRVWDRLSSDYHVLAPDLPGFGRSDRPPLAYTASTYQDFVADFVDDLAENPICLASSLSGAYAASVAERRFDRLLLVCPTDDTGERRPRLRATFRSPILGEFLFAALTTKPSLRWWMEREGYEDPGNVDDSIIDYLHRTARQSGARYAPASFIGGFLTPERSLGEMLRAADAPTTLLWGREATRTPLALGRRYAAAAEAELLIIDDTRLLPHAERPDVFLDTLRDSGTLPDLESE
jgi:pimeloyl-ACP methyl ester carboxylesterase